MTATISGGIPAATSSTPVLNTYGQEVAANEAATAAAASSTSSSSSSTAMVQMWDPWNHTEDGPLVPASGIMLTNPSTGQQVDSASVFSAYKNYYGSNPQEMILNLSQEWGQKAVTMFEQQNPSINVTSGSTTTMPTVFQEIGPYNPFYDPNNGGQMAIFDSSGTEYLI